VLLQSYGLLGVSKIVSAVEDDAAPALLIPLILFANWSYTKMAKREIKFAFNHMTLLSTQNY